MSSPLYLGTPDVQVLETLDTNNMLLSFTTTFYVSWHDKIVILYMVEVQVSSLKTVLDSNQYKDGDCD